jgi:hypothetical protein
MLIEEILMLSFSSKKILGSMPVLTLGVSILLYGCAEQVRQADPNPSPTAETSKNGNGNPSGGGNKPGDNRGERPNQPAEESQLGGDPVKNPELIQITNFNAPAVANIALEWDVLPSNLSNFAIDICYAKPGDKDRQCLMYFDVSCNQKSCQLTNLDPWSDQSKYSFSIVAATNASKQTVKRFKFSDLNSLWASLNGWIVSFRVSTMDGSSLSTSKVTSGWVYTEEYQ